MLAFARETGKVLFIPIAHVNAIIQEKRRLMRSRLSISELRALIVANSDTQQASRNLRGRMVLRTNWRWLNSHRWRLVSSRRRKEPQNMI